MNSTTSIWAGVGLVLAASLIVVLSEVGMLSIACVLAISIILIGLGLIADGLEESYDDE